MQIVIINSSCFGRSDPEDGDRLCPRNIVCCVSDAYSEGSSKSLWVKVGSFLCLIGHYSMKTNGKF